MPRPLLSNGYPTLRTRRGVCASMAGLVSAGWITPGWARTADGVRIQGHTLQGEAFDLGAWRGKTVLINFWATWCSPCRKEMPLIDAYYRAHRAQGLEVLALSMDEASDERLVRQLASSFAFPVAMYSQVDIRGFKRIWRMPVCALVSPAGVLVEQDLFFDPPLNERSLDALLRPWLHDGAGASAPQGTDSGPSAAGPG